MYQDIEFRHGLYDFQGHHAGTKLGRDDAAEQAIVELVDGADMALYRKEGYFFEGVIPPLNSNARGFYSVV